MTCCCEARALTGGGAYVQTDVVQAGGWLGLDSCSSPKGQGGGFHVAGSFTQAAGHARFSFCRAAHGGGMSVGGSVSVAGFASFYMCDSTTVFEASGVIVQSAAAQLKGLLQRAEKKDGLPVCWGMKYSIFGMQDAAYTRKSCFDCMFFTYLSSSSCSGKISNLTFDVRWRWPSC